MTKPGRFVQPRTRTRTWSVERRVAHYRHMLQGSRYHIVGPEAAAPDPVATPRVTAEHLEAAIGKALYGWGGDEPNEATGWTTRTEVKRVVLAVIETLSGDPRLDPVASPASLDVTRLIRALWHLPNATAWLKAEADIAEFALAIAPEYEGQPVAEEPA